MRITLVIHALSGGGAERVVSLLANYWATHGSTVSLIALSEPDRPIAYEIHPSVYLQQIGVIGDSPKPIDLLLTGMQRIQTVRRSILQSQPDIIISFMGTVNVIVLTACVGLKIPIVVSEHIYPAFEDANKIWQFLMKQVYRWADTITVLTQSALPFYPAHSGYRTVVMPNPILPPSVSPESDQTRLLPSNSIVAIGRLHPQKGFDLLIQAFAQVRVQHPNWQLTILGEGHERDHLEQLRSQLSLTDSVHLPGRVTEVNDYLKQADLFVMPSRFEGFPMALCEAMAIGTPVLSTDCLSGPREIIADGVDGKLVPPDDIQALAQAISALINNPEQRSTFSKNSPTILDRFGIDRVMAQWDTLLNGLQRSV
jgi:GalNAc-alpha-(1->4)-GalNAc-alpha-(1->3)-diNAcBac-PP-undecaprenol alpha-1,4-N-acetyl-D-galactosaminyltransferase